MLLLKAFLITALTCMAAQATQAATPAQAFKRFNGSSFRAKTVSLRPRTVRFESNTGSVWQTRVTLRGKMVSPVKLIDGTRSGATTPGGRELPGMTWAGNIRRSLGGGRSVIEVLFPNGEVQRRLGDAANTRARRLADPLAGR
jgi:hypothetical protein